MLVSIENGLLTGDFCEVSTIDGEASFLAANPSYIKVDFDFTEDKDLYEYSSGAITLATGWETTKAARLVSNAASELSNATTAKLAELKAHFLTVSERPRVATTLGWPVDGNYNDLANFQIGKDLGLLAVKDADGVTRSIVIDDYDVILLAIKVRGLSLLQVKWTHEASIAALNTAATISAYDVTAGWPS